MEKLKNINFALLAFIAFSVRIVALGANLSDAIALLVLAALYGGTKLLQAKAAEHADKNKEEFAKLVAKTNADIAMLNEKIEKEISEVRGSVAGIKLSGGRGFRNISGNGQ